MRTAEGLCVDCRTPVTYFVPGGHRLYDAFLCGPCNKSRAAQGREVGPVTEAARQEALKHIGEIRARTQELEIRAHHREETARIMREADPVAAAPSPQPASRHQRRAAKRRARRS